MSLKDSLKERKGKIVLALVSLAAPAVAFAASADINWTVITDIINGMATNLIPGFVNLVTAAVPLLIILAIVGFILKFLDRILEMIHMK